MGAHTFCGGFHTTRARCAGWYPLGALDIYIAPPPLEAWGAVIESLFHDLPHAHAAFDHDAATDAWLTRWHRPVGGRRQYLEAALNEHGIRLCRERPLSPVWADEQST